MHTTQGMFDLDSCLHWHHPPEKVHKNSQEFLGKKTGRMKYSIVKGKNRRKGKEGAGFRENRAGMYRKRRIYTDLSE